MIPTYLGVVFFLLFFGIESFANTSNDSISGVWSLDSIVEKSFENNVLIDADFSGPDTDENVQYDFQLDGTLLIRVNTNINSTRSYTIDNTHLLINNTGDGSYNYEGNFYIVELTNSSIHIKKTDGSTEKKVETHFYLTR